MMTLDEAARGPMYTRLRITNWTIPNEDDPEYWGDKGYEISG
jgi:hypothetical protein